MGNYKKEKIRNVLLTTMSTLNNRTLNYYFVDGGIPQYCSGISQIEPGAKYILSTQPVDELVVIGSPETYDSETAGEKKRDILIVDDILKEQKAMEDFNPQKASAFAFFKYRISQFLAGEDVEEQAIGGEIEPERKQELQNIVAEVLKAAGETGTGEWFRRFSESSEKNSGLSLSQQLRKSIESDIRKNFIDESDYEKYSGAFEQYSEVRELQDIEESLSAMMEELDRMKQSSKITLLVKEFFCIRSTRKLEKQMQELRVELSEGRNEIYKKLILELSSANRRFIEELNALKSNRLNKEVAYARQYLYEQMNDNYRMKSLPSNRQLKLHFVPARIDGVENIGGIVDAICGKDSGKIQLFIDMQGGSRTDGYVRNAVLSILNNELNGQVKIRKIVATDFNPRNFANGIVDETKRYQITDLVSGMNAFIQYGKANLIQEYWENMGISDARVSRLVTAMALADEALSICDIDLLITAMNRMHGIFCKKEKQVQKNEISSIFRVLENGIQRDYAGIFDRESGTVNIPELVKWAVRKGFLQQAMTIIESKMPHEFARNGIYYYCKGEQDKAACLNTFKKIHDEKNSSWQDYMFLDLDHFVMRYYIRKVKGERMARTMIKRLRNNAVGADELKFYSLCRNTDDLYNLLDPYYSICILRNETSHAVGGRQRTSGKEIEKIINDFLKSYEKVLSSIGKLKNDSICLTYEEMKDGD